MIGQTISHYKILEKLGEGGMGVVYKAEDLKLQRAVALKILPREALVSEQDRIRFAREAQAAASLNHPNIAMIHEFDEVDDSISDRKIAFIAMEYIDGVTLKEKVEERPLPLKEVVSIAMAVAEGMAKAHEKGIVHRDIKSQNIMISKEGAAKIMDFGLAEVAGKTRLTREGSTVGTIAYMSPEQGRGEKLDRRTDIWSLGVVLYEMISGRLPFPGSYDQAIMYQILNEEPEAVTSLRSNVPIELERVVKKAMQKDPDDRYQHVDDMIVDLKLIKKELGSAPAHGISQQFASREVEAQSAELRGTLSRLKKHRAVWLTATVFLFISFLAMVIFYPRRPSSSQQVIRSTILPPANLIFSNALGGHIALSPDGRRLAFVTSDSNGFRLWVRALDYPSAQPLAGTEGAFYPFWSPDSRYIGFFAAGKLMKIAASGGPVTKICDAHNPRGATWSDRGVIVIAPEPGGALYQVSAAGGTPSTLTVLDTMAHELSQRWPHFLPDGNHLIYFGYSTPGRKDNAIFVTSLDDRVSKRLMFGESNVAYANGYLLFVRQTSLMAQPFDVATLEISGEAVPIAENVRYDVGMARADFSVSQTGLLALSGGVPEAVKELLVVDRTGRVLSTLGDPMIHFDARLSPDGKRVALGHFDIQSQNQDVWILEILRGTLVRLTSDQSSEMSPIWAQDGNRILFTSDRGRKYGFYIKDLRGTGPEKILFESDLETSATDWSFDSRYIVFAAVSPGVPKFSRDIWVLPLFSDQKPIPFLQTGFDEWDGRFSPDGRWIAYVSDESGSYEIYVRPFPGPGRAYRVSKDGGIQPRWRSDGKEIFFNRGGQIMTAELRSAGSAFEVAHEKPLFRPIQWDLMALQDVYPGGQKLLVTASTARLRPLPVTLVVNWVAELPKR